MRILVTGGRRYSNYLHIYDILDKSVTDRVNTIMIQGGATGADEITRSWSNSRKVHCATITALWTKFGNSAGPKRNKAMLLLQPDKVIAFEGGKGTANMVKLAREAGIEAEEY